MLCRCEGIRLDSKEVSHSPDYAALVLAEKMLRQHEGVRQYPYRCTQNYLTVGVGRNLDTVGLRPDEIELMLANDISASVDDLRTFEWWPELTPNRKAALIDLRFCLGGSGFRTFRRMIQALEARNHDWAAAEILDSKFKDQTGSRAQDLASLMESG